MRFWRKKQQALANTPHLVCSEAIEWALEGSRPIREKRWTVDAEALETVGVGSLMDSLGDSFEYVTEALIERAQDDPTRPSRALLEVTVRGVLRE